MGLRLGLRFRLRVRIGRLRIRVDNRGLWFIPASSAVDAVVSILNSGHFACLKPIILRKTLYKFGESEQDIVQLVAVLVQ